MKKSFFILSIVLLFGCHPHYEVYEHYPKDTVLTYDMFKRSDRIFMTDSFLILKVNVVKNEDLSWDLFYYCFLFFFNDSLQLKYACFAPWFDSLVNKTFYISYDTIRYSYKYLEHRTCDLPKGYTRIVEKPSKYKSYKRFQIRCYYPDTLIIRNDSLLIYGLTTDSGLICYNWCKSFDTLRNPSVVFKKKDTIFLRLDDLVFDYECREAHIFKVVDSCENRLIIKLDTNKFRLLYNSLINYFTHKNK